MTVRQQYRLSFRVFSLPIELAITGVTRQLEERLIECVDGNKVDRRENGSFPLAAGD